MIIHRPLFCLYTVLGPVDALLGQNELRHSEVVSEHEDGVLAEKAVFPVFRLVGCNEKPGLHSPFGEKPLHLFVEKVRERS